ncbi:MAG: pyridoxamine 5'-phosphate oxidase family protein [Candidatus Levybacteria bacterium]|nr:pyridoxamine 5'-phosphate oxidase family protein [Candidatus Levybacteria bacterium]
MDQKAIILEFIKKQKLAVLSTVTPKNTSQSAVLEFGQTQTLKIIFDTFSSSRKYKNIKHNNNVSLVIGWDEDITVQYEGKAYELEGKEKEDYKKIYFEKNPEAQRWETKEGMTYFKVVPTWIRYSDLNKNPWEIYEVKMIERG